MQRPGERKSRYRRAYLEEAWGSFDAMFPSKYRPGSSKRKFETVHRRWIHSFYQITKHAEDSGIQLMTLWADGGWLFEAVSKRQPARLTHSILRKVNRSLGISDEYNSARKQSDSSRVAAIVDLKDSPQISASEVDHSTSFVAEEQIKSESESESESGCYSDSTYDERAHLTLRVTRSSSRPKTPRPCSDLPRPVTSAVKVKAECIDSPIAVTRTSMLPSPMMPQTLESMSFFMSPSPGGSDIQIDTSQRSSAKRRFDQVEDSSANQSPDSRLPRRARRRRLTTAESDQESTSPMQWDRASMSVENTSAREAFNEAFARWSAFATTEKKQNTGDKIRDLGDCEEELRRLEERLAVAQKKHDRTHQQIEAIDKLIAAAVAGQDEGDGIGIERSSGGAWVSLLATAERTREVLEGEAQEKVEALSTAVEAMRADVARLTDEAEMQRLVGVVAKGMEDLSGLVEKRY